MELQIDTQNKTIRVLSISYKINELLEELKKLNIDIEEYTITNYSSTIISTPWQQPWIGNPSPSIPLTNPTWYITSSNNQ